MSVDRILLDMSFNCGIVCGFWGEIFVLEVSSVIEIVLESLYIK